MNDLNDGSALVGYFGHGSVTQWGKDNMFTVKDVETLQNGGKLPVVINMTCLAGLFTHPAVQSLAETLLWKPDGGAVAVLAPDQSDAVLRSELFEQRSGEGLLAGSRGAPGRHFLAGAARHAHGRIGRARRAAHLFAVRRSGAEDCATVKNRKMGRCGGEVAGRHSRSCHLF